VRSRQHFAELQNWPWTHICLAPLQQHKNSVTVCWKCRPGVVVWRRSSCCDCSEQAYCCADQSRGMPHHLTCVQLELMLEQVPSQFPRCLLRYQREIDHSASVTSFMAALSRKWWRLDHVTCDLHAWRAVGTATHGLCPMPYGARSYDSRLFPAHVRSTEAGREAFLIRGGAGAVETRDVCCTTLRAPFCMPSLLFHHKHIHAIIHRYQGLLCAASVHSFHRDPEAVAISQPDPTLRAGEFAWPQWRHEKWSLPLYITTAIIGGASALTWLTPQSQCEARTEASGQQLAGGEPPPSENAVSNIHTAKFVIFADKARRCAAEVRALVN
jgi:hypothetical protein